MMNIEHIALYVRDLEATKEFFVKFFGALPSNIYHNPKTNFKSYFLKFDGGTKLEIMSRPGLSNQNDTQMRTGFIHMAFSVGNAEEVNRLTNELEENGYTVASGPRITGDGCYESCIIGPEGNLLEITV